ncbi:MAG: hypothetical protein J7623_21540 [Chitinophaga sp.]|uniref:hypothetical protein n=1 Tax=Chitinophaga sp. TaxID=1869181 RepID=UPI001B2DC6C2|nr:hypothetical protein [Chitinophaga sp.]MBO9731237.1 hypothetical protein [Chitinophaga sp.]
MLTTTLSLLSIYLTILHLIYHQATSHTTLFPFNNGNHVAIRERMGDMLLSLLFFFLPLPAILLHSRIWLSVTTFLTGFSLVEEWHTWRELYGWSTEKAWQQTALLAIRR